MNAASSPRPLITVAVPSFNQGRFLNDALQSLFAQQIPLEVYVADGGSVDNSIEILEQWDRSLTGWRSYPDSGQAAAINECIARGKAPFVCWLNADDLLLPGGLSILWEVLQSRPEWPAVYGRVWNTSTDLKKRSACWTQPFSERRMALRCIVSQPGTLIRRSAWEAVGGLKEDLRLAMDYDLWWRLFRRFGPLGYVSEFVAINRCHALTKTRTHRRHHYDEAISVVRRYYGRVPLKWWLYWPIAVWGRALLARQLS